MWAVSLDRADIVPFDQEARARRVADRYGGPTVQLAVDTRGSVARLSCIGGYHLTQRVLLGNFSSSYFN